MPAKRDACKIGSGVICPYEKKKTDNYPRRKSNLFMRKQRIEALNMKKPKMGTLKREKLYRAIGKKVCARESKGYPVPVKFKDHVE